ncbi:2-isopropylmalate synthase [Rhodococcus hoagii]|uniref:alpha-isopropylmalate synthase regulatory domain-containing protein n=1 Tax=Prescottella TaxID=2979332 RepID=UPI000A0F715B|nr:alpha-isopropylmalate synthase regulatory domain-containing protein [Prescottella equi]MBM4726556.1 2-isopropylmalate synthase [Prescottella equi]NKR78756.1 2-isopropylmalate synthase [Prescottella equi]NKS40541.1 2-isopropylmalate synthase [Prescottella equi]ORL41389.1 2-isopropylmalate synthase [Prescottella equi]UNQ39500.1 2-isopropylmalate synthase [Prescottella equi]
MRTSQAFATTTFSNDPFFQRFGTHLPRDLRAQAQGLSWTEFAQRFSPTGGPVRLGSWTSEHLGAGRHTFTATLGLGDRISSASATATGPIAALTSMLFDAGFQLEILSFHQQRTSEGTATFILAEHDGERRWAMAIAEDCNASAREAIIAAANLLHR